MPLSVLKRAPYQLEVTVLSVETKEGPHSGESIWFRVRVDRVIVGNGLKVGDETAVVSQRYKLPRGAVGSTGDRGLPRKGDRMRVYADGNAKVLSSVPPNGWQPVGNSVAFLAADEDARAEESMPFLAGVVKECGVGSTSVHFAAAGNGTGSAGAANPREKGYFTDIGRMHSSGDTVVLAVRGLEPDRNTPHSVNDALFGGRDLVAFRASVDTFSAVARGQREPQSRFGTETLGTRITTEPVAGTMTRVVPPEDATHPVLAGLQFPKGGLVLPSGLIEVAPLPTDCRVLLWGEAVDAGGKVVGKGAKQPVLWVRELERKSLVVRDVETKFPAQRIAVTTLGDAADFSNPEFRLLAVQLIAWAGDETTSVDDADRAKVRGAKFELSPK